MEYIVPSRRFKDWDLEPVYDDEQGSHIDYYYAEGEELPKDYQESGEDIAITRIIVLTEDGISYILNRNSESLRNLYPDSIFQFYGYACSEANCIKKLNYTNHNHKDQSYINEIKKELVAEYNIDCDDNDIASEKYKKALKALVSPLKEYIDSIFDKIKNYVLKYMTFKERGDAYWYIKNHPECMKEFYCINDIYESLDKIYKSALPNWKEKKAIIDLRVMQILCFECMRKYKKLPSLQDIMDYAKGEKTSRKFRKNSYDLKKI